MKYVVYQDGAHEYMVVFPYSINHDRMAEAITQLRFGGERDWHRRQGEILSAGFVEGGACVGRSESLGINSRKGLDTVLYKLGGCSVKHVPELDVNGAPKLPLTIMEAMSLEVCNLVKAWAESDRQAPFPQQAHMLADTVLLMATQRRQGVQ